MFSFSDVDDGSTVTDFLPAERARGITIQSAAITFHWPPSPPEQSGAAALPAQARSRASHTINLIDTPGHADFTFEVLRSLRILDGAVCILDGVAGVEAQTEKVWHQAANYHIPKIIYVNKLDRDGAAFGKTVKEIASRLHTWPAVCQIPWWEGGNGRFIGVGDAVSLQGLWWADGDGRTVKTVGIDEIERMDQGFADEIRKARMALMELLSEFDDQIVEKYLEYDDDHLAIQPEDIVESLRRCLQDASSRMVPVYAGASFKNIGVQPLLDAIVDTLPSPQEAADPEVSVGAINGRLKALIAGNLLLEAPDSNPPKSKKAVVPARKSKAALVENLEACALAFKVVNDPRRGVLVYVRVYSGTINRNASLFNTNLQISEKAPRLLRMYASDALDIPTIPAGQIGVILGLKHARTGDTLVSYIGTNPKTGPPAPLNTLQLRPIEVPPPVFFASIEPHSLSEQKAVADALALLLREDPSLHCSVDEESGQTLLSGMGELHLEIARDRLVQDFKAKASMGRIEIGYRECLQSSSSIETAMFDRETAGRKGKAGCTASAGRFVGDDEAASTVVPNIESSVHQDGNCVTVSVVGSTGLVEDSESSGSLLPPHLPLTTVYTALANGAFAALARGPRYTYAMYGTKVTLTLDPTLHVFANETTPATLSSAARLATQAALKNAAAQGGTALMEPVMNVIISVDEASLGAVVHDISSSRGGHIVSLDDADVIDASTHGEMSREDLPLIDIRKVYAPPDPFAASSVAGGEDLDMASGGNRQRSITAKVPLKEMVGYLKHLRSLTGGRGTFVMSVDRFERMGGQREKALLKDLSGI